MTLPTRIYTAKEVAKEVEKAHQRGWMVGWVQGGGAVILGGIALRLLGWIPAIAVVGLLVWVLYKLVSGSQEEPSES